MRRKYFSAAVALCLAAVMCVPAYSDERLSAAFAAKDTDAVLAVLNAASGDEDKKALESDVLKEARALVFSGTSTRLPVIPKPCCCSTSRTPRPRNCIFR